MFALYKNSPMYFLLYLQPFEQRGSPKISTWKNEEILRKASKKQQVFASELILEAHSILINEPGTAYGSSLPDIRRCELRISNTNYGGRFEFEYREASAELFRTNRRHRVPSGSTCDV